MYTADLRVLTVLYLNEWVNDWYFRWRHSLEDQTYFLMYFRNMFYYFSDVFTSTFLSHETGFNLHISQYQLLLLVYKIYK